MTNHQHVTTRVPVSGLLDGRRVLVTGAAAGIGRAIATHCIAAGARVALADRVAIEAGAVAEIGAVGAWQLDATDEAQVDEVVPSIESELGAIDVLVVAHGILRQGSFAELSTTAWEEMISVDLTSVFRMNRAVMPGMLARRDGRIINVASQLALKGGASMAHYAAAKAGVVAMTKSLALEVSSRGVLANVIAPGPVETAMLGGVDEQWRSAKLAELPLGRFGHVDEIAPTAVLLASDPGGNLYVGQVLGPNAGDVMP